MQPKQNLRKEIDTLIGEYGVPMISRLVGITERGVQYWIAEEGEKLPSGKRAEKVHELFERHKSGENLRKAVETPKNGLTEDYKDKYIASLERENQRLQEQLEMSLGEMRHNQLLGRAILEVNQELLIEILSKQRKESLEETSVKVSKENFLRYQRLKEEGNFSYVGK